MNPIRLERLLDYLRALGDLPTMEKVAGQERINRTCDAVEKELEINDKQK